MTLKKISLAVGLALYIKLVFRYLLRTLIPVWRWLFFWRLNRLIPMSALTHHLYAIAGTKSGKSEFLKALVLRHAFNFWGLFKKKQSTETKFIFDPHGDCSKEIARFKNHRTGKDLAYIFGGLDPEHVVCMNPFDLGKNAGNKRLISFMAEHLTTAFSDLMIDSNVSANMRSFLMPIFYILLKRPDSTFLDFRRFLDDTQNADLLEYALKHCSPGQKDFFQNKFHKHPRTKEALHIKIQDLLNYESFYDMTIGKSTINIQELMDSKKTVIFNLSKLDGELAGNAFGRLLMAMIKGYGYFRQSIPKSERVPVFIYIDEFQNFVSPTVSNILEELRKYGIHLGLFHQHTKQIDSSKIKESILTNCAIKVTGSVSGESLTTMHKEMPGASKEYIQGLLKGNFLVKVKPDTLWESVFFKYAFPLRVTTSYLGHRYSMKPQEWEKVKKSQLRQYYRRTDGHTETEVIPEVPTPQTTFKKPSQAKYGPRNTPVTPKFAL